MNVEKIGQKIKTLRLAANMTQADLGSFLNCSESLISYIEKGQRTVSDEDLARLAKLFKVSMDEFLSEPISNSRTTLFRSSAVSGAVESIDVDQIKNDFKKYAESFINEENK